MLYFLVKKGVENWKIIKLMLLFSMAIDLRLKLYNFDIQLTIKLNKNSASIK